MAKYKLTGVTYINNTLYTEDMLLKASEEGREIVVDYDGIPGSTLEPVDDAAKAAKAAAKRGPVPIDFPEDKKTGKKKGVATPVEASDSQDPQAALAGAAGEELT